MPTRDVRAWDASGHVEPMNAHILPWCLGVLSKGTWQLAPHRRALPGANAISTAVATYHFRSPAGARHSHICGTHREGSQLVSTIINFHIRSFSPSKVAPYRKPMSTPPYRPDHPTQATFLTRIRIRPACLSGAVRHTG